MKTVILNREALYDAAAAQLRELVEKKPDAVIAMAAGRTMLPLWDRLRGVNLSEVRLFQVAEFLNTPEEKTLRHMTEEGLLRNTDIRPENCFWLTEDSPSDADSLIGQLGGLDLAVLGLGNNAHIGFNEPATQFDTRCRKQKLTEKTRKQYAWLFGSEDAAPETGVTLGIRSLTEARSVAVIATGEEKAKPSFEMLYARDDSVIPAAFLQIPPEVTVYLDTEAAGKL